MLIGYVSDEWDVAIPGAAVEIEKQDGSRSLAFSAPSGAVHADIEPGPASVALAATGFGSKRTAATLDADRPMRFRMLSNRPYGYMWPKWSAAGTSADVRVHAPSGYELSLWRYGWKPELIADIGCFDPHPPGAHSQLLPDGDVAALGTDWQGPSVDNVPIDARLRQRAPHQSGLYYFHVRGHDGKHTSFPWVVSPARPRHRIAVLTSSLTWNAYNDFGGRSNYVAASALPPRPTVAARQEQTWYPDPAEPPWIFDEYDPLSLERPEPVNAIGLNEAITDPMIVRGGEHLAPAEWRLLGWMEREGLAHDLYADAQLQTGDLPLDAYDIVVLSTHPEYWTTRMVDDLNTWVTERGGRLAYLGGNGLNCPVRLEGPSMICDNGSDYRRASSRMTQRHTPEAALLGVQTTLTGYETGAPYRVLKPDHWAFAGLGLTKDDLVGTTSLDCRAPGGASGHETDKWTADTPASAILLAKGTNPDEGGAELTYLTFPGGGEVFSVGSISYTCSIPVDPAISRITANVLTRWLHAPESQR